MALSQNEARDALKAVAATKRRSGWFRTYRTTSPHLILWGMVWVLGYGITGLAPERWINPSWLVLIAAAIAVSSRLNSNVPALSRSKPVFAWVPAVVFYVAVLTVMQPTHSVQFEIFPALCVALLYAYFGIFRAPAFLWLSALIFLLAMGGYFLLPAHWLPFWLALCGGGSLIASGLWLGRL